MKKDVLVLIFLLVSLGNSSAQWINLNSGTDKTLLDLRIFNEDTVIVIADSGLVLKTTDGGLSWNQYGANLNERLVAVDFLNDSLGIAVGLNGLMTKTNNGGVSWTSFQNLPANLYFRDVRLINDSCIVSGGSFGSGNILKSFDAGLNWIIDSISNSLINSIDYLNATTWFAASNYAEIFKTTNQGLNWQLLNFATTYNNIMSLDVVNDSLIFGTGYVPNCMGCFLSSLDGGINWYYSPMMGRDLYFFANGVGYFLKGPAGYAISKTLDYGVNYSDQFITPFDTVLTAIKFANENVGYVVGSHGTIMKTINGGVTAINELNHASNFDVFPNPCDESISIKSKINQSVEFNLYDVTGRSVLQKHFNETLSLNIRELSKGVYFYSIKYNDEIIQNGKVMKE